MITEIVTFPLPIEMSREQAIFAYWRSVPTWQQNLDLLRKQFLYNPADRLGGVVYLWKSLEDAKRWHGDGYQQKISEIFGSQPTFRYCESHVVIDNDSGVVIEEED